MPQDSGYLEAGAEFGGASEAGLEQGWIVDRGSALSWRGIVGVGALAVGVYSPVGCVSPVGELKLELSGRKWWSLVGLGVDGVGVALGGCR